MRDSKKNIQSSEIARYQIPGRALKGVEQFGETCEAAEMTVQHLISEYLHASYDGLGGQSGTKNRARIPRPRSWIGATHTKFQNQLLGPLRLKGVLHGGVMYRNWCLSGFPMFNKNILEVVSESSRFKLKLACRPSDVTSHPPHPKSYPLVHCLREQTPNPPSSPYVHFTDFPTRGGSSAVTHGHRFSQCER